MAVKKLPFPRMAGPASFCRQRTDLPAPGGSRFLEQALLLPSLSPERANMRWHLCTLWVLLAGSLVLAGCVSPPL